MLKKRLGLGSNVRAATVSAAGEGPVWNEIMPAGEWHRSDWGVINVTRELLEKMIANWKAKGSPKLPIDRHHWGSSNETRVTDPKAKAAVGWLTDFRISAKDTLEGLTKWLPEGKADVDAERFQYISPEFHEAWPDAATGELEPTLFGASLLNDPYFLGHLQPLAANDSPSKENLMDRTKLIALYALAATATDAEIEAAVRAGADAKRTAAESVDKRTAAEKRTGELELELSKEREARLAGEKRIAAIEQAAADAKVKADGEALCAKLEREGRIAAIEKAAVLEDVKTYGLEKATARYAARAPIVNLGGPRSAGTPPTGEQGDALKQFEAKVAELEKSGVAPVTATRRAAKENPELYRSAFPSTPKASA